MGRLTTKLNAEHQCEMPPTIFVVQEPLMHISYCGECGQNTLWEREKEDDSFEWVVTYKPSSQGEALASSVNED